MTEFELTVKDGQIVVTEEVANALARAQILDKTIKELTAQRDAIVKPLKAAMDKNGITSFKSQYLNVSHTAGSMTETVNVEKMKDDGIYERYVMFIPKNSSYRVTYPKEKKNA